MNPNPQHKDAPSHSAQIRANTSYPELRGIINLLFWLGLISLGFTFCWLIGRTGTMMSSKDKGELLVLVIISAISALVLIALRIFFTMLIDMADSLLHEHTKLKYRE